MIAGLEDPSDGIIRIGDRIVNDVEPKDRDIAMVFQSYALYPHMTVRRNIEFPLKTRKLSAEERRTLVDESARILGLDELLDRKPGQLSGGQRQRVALARAIVRRPDAFLMDEPLSNLDAKLRVATRAELVELHRRLETTIVYVTHDQVEAMTMATRIVILDRGRLQQIGPPRDVYDRPANLFVAAFIGSPPMNTVSGHLATDTDEPRLRVPGAELKVPGTRRVRSARCRPRTSCSACGPSTCGSGAAGIPAEVTVIESLGHEQHVVCRLVDGQMLIARLPADAPTPVEGENVHLNADEGALHLFDSVTGTRAEW